MFQNLLRLFGIKAKILKRQPSEGFVLLDQKHDDQDRLDGLGEHGGQSDGEDILAILLHMEAQNEEEVEGDIKNAT